MKVAPSKALQMQDKIDFTWFLLQTYPVLKKNPYILISVRNMNYHASDLLISGNWKSIITIVFKRERCSFIVSGTLVSNI